MAGSLSLSLSQQFDANGNPLAGGKLFFYQAGTVATPQNAYQDTSLTIPHPNPITLDAAGRCPAFYLSDGNIKILLTDANGITQITADNLLVIGPSSGGGGGGAVDSTTVAATGDLKIVYGTSTLSGWARLNGRTIGSATSGATERANADTSALFSYLWNADSNLSVSGGRGASAAADFAANKTIALPDARGRGFMMLDDMGTSAAGRYGSATFTSGTATTLGAVIGAAQKTLAIGNMPAHDHGGATGNDSPDHTHTTFNVSQITGAGGSTYAPYVSGSSSNIVNTNIASSGASARHTHTITSQGSGTAFDLYTPSILVTAFIKL